MTQPIHDARKGMFLMVLDGAGGEPRTTCRVCGSFKVRVTPTTGLHDALSAPVAGEYCMGRLAGMPCPASLRARGPANALQDVLRA